MIAHSKQRAHASNQNESVFKVRTDLNKCSKSHSFVVSFFTLRDGAHTWVGGWVRVGAGVSVCKCVVYQMAMLESDEHVAKRLP